MPIPEARSGQNTWEPQLQMNSERAWREEVRRAWAASTPFPLHTESMGKGHR